MNVRYFPTVLFASAWIAGCTTSEDPRGASEDLKRKAVTTYADIVYASYVDCRESASALKMAIDALVTSPSQGALDSARAAWKSARIPYGQTEVYRFYNGPIDNEKDGPEGLMNAWPLDEAHIDYVAGDSHAGIINQVDSFPTLDKNVLAKANENPGEADIATGYHAIEFLLWGQDLEAPDKNTPGKRPYTDYIKGAGGTASNPDRRGTYLKLVGELLLENLDQLVEAWKPGAQNYRSVFLGANPDSSLAKIMVGMGSLSGAELSGERMTVAMKNGDQEDEHSCFSDNTHQDIAMNSQGILNVYLGSYTRISGSKFNGTGLFDVVKAADASLADSLKAQIANSVEKAKSIEPPFDLAVSLGNAAGRAKVQAAIDALKAQTATTAGAAKALGITLNLEE